MQLGKRFMLLILTYTAIQLLPRLTVWSFSSSCTLRKIPQFHLISGCESFVGRYSFRIVSGKSPKTMQKIRLSTKFSHQKIRWNYGIFCSGSKFEIHLALLKFNNNSLWNTKKCTNSTIIKRSSRIMWKTNIKTDNQIEQQ